MPVLQLHVREHYLWSREEYHLPGAAYRKGSTCLSRSGGRIWGMGSAWSFGSLSQTNLAPFFSFGTCLTIGLGGSSRVLGVVHAGVLRGGYAGVGGYC